MLCPFVCTGSCVIFCVPIFNWRIRDCVILPTGLAEGIGRPCLPPRLYEVKQARMCSRRGQRTGPQLLLKTLSPPLGTTPLYLEEKMPAQEGRVGPQRARCEVSLRTAERARVTPARLCQSAGLAGSKFVHRGLCMQRREAPAARQPAPREGAARASEPCERTRRFLVFPMGRSRPTRLGWEATWGHCARERSRVLSKCPPLLSSVPAMIKKGPGRPGRCPGPTRLRGQRRATPSAQVPEGRLCLCAGRAVCGNARAH